MAKTYTQFTARRVLTVEWLDGEKLSQSTADDVGTLVNLGVICYLKQLLDTGFFHAGVPRPPLSHMTRTAKISAQFKDLRWTMNGNEAPCRPASGARRSAPLCTCSIDR